MEAIRTTSPRRGGELPLFDRIALALLFLFLLTEVLDGAIRYYAIKSGLPWLPYVPHLLVFLALFPMFFVFLVTEGINSTYLWLVVLLSVAATYGLFNLGNASQLEFGVWVLAGLLYGIVVLPAVIHNWRRLIPYVFLLWAIALSGVLINALYTWPWIGFEYEFGGTQIEVSRLWRTNGIRFARLPGFSTGSYFAAPQLLLLALFLRITLRRKPGLLVWCLSGVAIVLTTDKTTIGIYLVISLLFLFSRGYIRPSWRLIPILSAGLDVVLPFSMLLYRLDWVSSIQSSMVALIVWSFTDRLQVTWPEYIRTIIARGNMLLGRGLGGIGTAQQHFESAVYMPADNVAIYLYGTFGVLGLAALIFYGWKVSHLRVESPQGQFFFLCACVVVLAGLTTSVLEGGFAGLAFGLSLRYLHGRTMVAKHPAYSPRPGMLSVERPGHSPA